MFGWNLVIILLLQTHLVASSKSNDALLYEELQLVFEKSIEDQPDQPGAYLQLADLHKENKEYEKAISILQKALASIIVDTTDHIKMRRIYYNLGVIQQMKGDYEHAIASYEMAISYDPMHVNSFYNSGLAFQEIGDQDAAMEALSYALSLEPNHTDSRINICNILSAKNHFSLAENCYEDVLQIDQNNVNAYVGLGGLYHMMNDLDKSKEKYKKAVSLDETNLFAKFALKALGNEVESEGEGENEYENSSHEYVEVLFDAYAKNFDNSLVKDLDYVAPQLIAEKLLQSSLLDKSLKILDLGAGTGLLCESLKRMDSSGRIQYISGVDISSKMISKAETKNCYNDVYVSELKQFLQQQQITRQEFSVQYNVYAAADVFVYIGDFWDIVDICMEQIKRNHDNSNNDISDGRGVIIFTVEAQASSLIDVEESNSDRNSDHVKKNTLYRLTTSGRYTHTKRYLLDNLARSGVTRYQISDVILRKNRGVDVKGYLVSFYVSV